MPKLGLTMTEGTITEWLVKTGETVTKGSIIMLFETDKVEAEVEAEADGIVTHAAQVGDTLEPGEMVGWLLAEGEQPPDGTPLETDSTGTQEPVNQEPVNQEPDERVEVPEISEVQEENQSEQSNGQSIEANGRTLASPNAKRVAEELGITLDGIAGTGPGGRITSDDVQSFAATQTGAVTQLV